MFQSLAQRCQLPMDAIFRIELRDGSNVKNFSYPHFARGGVKKPTFDPLRPNSKRKKHQDNLRNPSLHLKENHNKRYRNYPLNASVLILRKPLTSPPWLNWWVGWTHGIKSHNFSSSYPHRTQKPKPRSKIKLFGPLSWGCWEQSKVPISFFLHELCVLVVNSHKNLWLISYIR